MEFQFIPDSSDASTVHVIVSDELVTSTLALSTDIPFNTGGSVSVLFVNEKQDSSCSQDTDFIPCLSLSNPISICTNSMLVICSSLSSEVGISESICSISPIWTIISSLKSSGFL